MSYKHTTYYGTAENKSHQQIIMIVTTDLVKLLKKCYKQGKYKIRLLIADKKKFQVPTKGTYYQPARKHSGKTKGEGSKKGRRSIYN